MSATTLSLLQWLTVIFGLVAAYVSIRYSVKFWTRKDSFGRVLSLMLAGEFVSMASVLIFALYTAVGAYADITPVNMMVLRWLIFSTALLTTLYLGYHIKKYH